MTIAADRIFRFKLVKRDFGPLASSIILHIARAHRIGGNLAQVVEERNGKQRITGILIGCPQVRNRHNKSSLSYNAKRGGPPEMGSPPL